MRDRKRIKLGITEAGYSNLYKKRFLTPTDDLSCVRLYRHVYVYESVYEYKHVYVSMQAFVYIYLYIFTVFVSPPFLRYHTCVYIYIHTYLFFNVNLCHVR